MTKITFGVIWLEQDSPVETGERLVMAAEQAQSICPVDQRIHIFRAMREGPIIAFKRVLEPAEIDQGISAIVKSLRIVSPHRDSAIKARQRLLWPLERTQSVAAVVERFGEIGFEGDGPVVALERVLGPSKHREDRAVVGVRCRRPRVGLERARNKVKRVRMVAALMLENAVEVERVEIVRIGVERAPIERFSFAQLTALVTQNRLPQRIGGGSCGAWLGLWFRHGLDDVATTANATSPCRRGRQRISS